MTKIQNRSLKDLIKQVLRRLKRGKVDHAMVGPVVLGRDGDNPYFIIVAGTEEECWIDQLQAHEWESVETLRAAVMTTLIQCKPIVIHDFDDELDMARFGEAIWPSRFTPIRLGIE